MKGVSIGRMGIMAAIAASFGALMGNPSASLSVTAPRSKGQFAARTFVNTSHVRPNIHGGGAGKKRRAKTFARVHGRRMRRGR